MFKHIHWIVLIVGIYFLTNGVLESIHELPKLSEYSDVIWVLCSVLCFGVVPQLQKD